MNSVLTYCGKGERRTDGRVCVHRDINKERTGMVARREESRTGGRRAEKGVKEKEFTAFVWGKKLSMYIYCLIKKSTCKCLNTTQSHICFLSADEPQRGAHGNSDSVIGAGLRVIWLTGFIPSLPWCHLLGFQM